MKDNLSNNINSRAEEKLQFLKDSGAYRHYIDIDKDRNTFPEFHFSNTEGIVYTAINFCTNDYLAFHTDHDVHSHFLEISKKTGLGAGGTRNISGNTIYHKQLEETIARWHQKESALLFNSAYQANFTTLQTLGTHFPELVFISDQENHASLIEGMKAAGNKKYIFKHNDLKELRSILNSIAASVPKLIVVESIYSMSGTIAPLQEMVTMAKEFGALIYLDEVHGVGLYGSNGSGLADELGVSDQIEFINGTMAKALGAMGGYIASTVTWIDFIRSFGKGFIFTSSLPPAICSAVKYTIHHIINNSSIRKEFWENIDSLRKSLDENGIKYSGHSSHITNIFIGDAVKCKQIADYLLFNLGLYLQPINYPTVPVGWECLRITITPRHQRAHIDRLIHGLILAQASTCTLTGRRSILSKVQMEVVREKINNTLPWVKIEMKYKDSTGDQLQNIPLHTQEGTDFFTKTLSQSLSDGEADIAVHSLKDMSSDHFFGQNQFAVVDRDEVRDIAIFSKDIEDKIKSGKKLRIGTCSFRREEMAIQFLKNALPGYGNKIEITALPIRGNIDTRINKLISNEYDGIVLAVAGINRMLKSKEYKIYFSELLSQTKWMILPLLACIPAPCQGAIVIENRKNNQLASLISDVIIDRKLTEECRNEKIIASKYGSGCIQKFGVSTIILKNQTSILAKGITDTGRAFEDWYPLELFKESISPEKIINSEDLGFQALRFPLSISNPILTKAVFISHINALNEHTQLTKQQRIWTAGINTWYKLAEKGYWVEGCADSLGLESILPTLSIPLIDLLHEDLTILTNNESAERWKEQGLNVIATYDIRYQSELIDKYKLVNADLIFWTCFAHFDKVKELIRPQTKHACLAGKTADLIKSNGIEPLIFPTQNAFNQWKKNYIRSQAAA